MFDAFTYFAWFVIAVLFLATAALIIWIGSLPGSIARKRQHPQADAINAASWIGLALAGVGWPFAFVWAFLRSGQVGYDGDGEQIPTGNVADQGDVHFKNEIARLEEQIAELQNRLNAQHRKSDES